jgi:hypothetical protein
LWRRPRPKLGCGAKERRRRKEFVNLNAFYETQFRKQQSKKKQSDVLN